MSPTRELDWTAYFDGEEEAGNYGHGPTEYEAILDFITNYAEDHLIRLGRWGRKEWVKPTPRPRGTT